MDKFPNEPVAVDAQYQIGYIWFTAAQTGTKDAAASQPTPKLRSRISSSIIRRARKQRRRALTSTFSNTSKRPTRTRSRNFTINKNIIGAAVIYYNEVIRQQPGSEESNEAKKRIDQLRAKFGDAALQPALAVSQTGKKKGEAHGARTAETGSAKPGAPNNDSAVTCTGD